MKHDDLEIDQETLAQIDKAAQGLMGLPTKEEIVGLETQDRVALLVKYLKIGKRVAFDFAKDVALVKIELGLPENSQPRYKSTGVSSPSSNAPSYSYFDLPGGGVFMVGNGFDQFWQEGRILRGEEAEENRKLKGSNSLKDCFEDDLLKTNKLAKIDQQFWENNQ